MTRKSEQILCALGCALWGALLASAVFDSCGCVSHGNPSITTPALFAANTLAIGAHLAGRVFRARKMWRASKVSIGIILLAGLGLLLVACTIAGDPCPDLGCPEGRVCMAGRCLPERGAR